MASGKCDLHLDFNFSTRILTSTHRKEFNIFFGLYMSLSPTINIQHSIMSKWLAKHISTEVSFKITIRKRHVYIDIDWPWIWNQCFYLRILTDDGIRMIVLTSFHLATRFNSQNANETEILMNSVTLICLWIFLIPIGIIEFSTSRKYCFWRYFSSLLDYWPSSTWNSLVHTSWGEMERREKRALKLLKMGINKISWNIKTKCVTDFL